MVSSCAFLTKMFIFSKLPFLRNIDFEHCTGSGGVFSNDAIGNVNISLKLNTKLVLDSHKNV